VASSIDRVKQSIRDRLEEIESERDQLMKALEALTGSSASVGARRGRPPGSGGGRSRVGKRAAGRRAPRGQRRQQVIDTLKAGEKGPSDIARQIGDVNPTQISGLLRQLASEGVVSRTAGGKWQLAAASQHEPPAAPAGDGNGAAAAEPQSFPS
jgi:predicted Rossmann fold nucleotide-binding protein DprA/Smf involved in DNA uptake